MGRAGSAPERFAEGTAVSLSSATPGGAAIATPFQLLPRGNGGTSAAAAATARRAYAGMAPFVVLSNAVVSMALRVAADVEVTGRQAWQAALDAWLGSLRVVRRLG